MSLGTYPPNGIGRISAERVRQIEQEEYDSEHDQQHWDEDLARAAVCYALPYSERHNLLGGRGASAPALWPWRESDWKPSPDDRIRELEKAGALIAAEIDRLQAQEG